MNKQSKIFIAGASGMVGSAIIRNLVDKGYTNLVGSYHSRVLNEQKDLPLQMVQIDLKNQESVNLFFKTEKPDYVFLAAAKVGGIHANNIYPAQFIYDNLTLQTNIIHAAHQVQVKRLLFLGSSCIYPNQAPQPMKEKHLLTGLLEPTNEPYAIAKIAGIKMCESYNRQYGTRFFAVMPTNLYGPNDNFDLETSHVLPALIRKSHEAKLSGTPQVVIWGTGSPRREFLHVDDMADGSIHVMKLSDTDVDKHLTNYPSPCFVNLGTGTDCTIKELALLIKEEVGYQGEIVFDTTKPDGTLLKLLDVSRLDSLGWNAKISLENGIKSTYNWFIRKGVC
ncbi:MAG: GDP-L-fucose synthase [Desulfobacula sp.]|uniref:GDP-L-fucose synthase family protein n=1 Tax=Desulfobacula sp. TaxID=2593537 RepID=UPI0025BFEECC|nr:GDP-L-fucose synthase [Desulfobacula sp.]MCD4722841.1 GDP-L-fucose synthase [Desulfobacula sp.]